MNLVLPLHLDGNKLTFSWVKVTTCASCLLPHVACHHLLLQLAFVFTSSRRDDPKEAYDLWPSALGRLSTHTHETHIHRQTLTWTSPKSLATFGADIRSRVPFALIFIRALRAEIFHKKLSSVRGLHKAAFVNCLWEWPSDVRVTASTTTTTTERQRDTATAAETAAAASSH